MNKILILSLLALLFSCSSYFDKSDYDFHKEIAEAKKHWGIDSLRLQTMFGFKLRMSEIEYNKHFDSLIKVGISDENHNIQYNGNFQSIWVNPNFKQNKLIDIEFGLSDISEVDTNSIEQIHTESSMYEIVKHLYGEAKIYKEGITYEPSNKSKIFSKQWGFGWIENNRFILVERSFLPSIDSIEDSRFKSVIFSDIELKEKFEKDKIIEDSIKLKEESVRKSKNVFK